MPFAGFDRADCPNLTLMATLKAETNLSWVGYYLPAPSQPATTWRGKRAVLVAQGWGLAPIYVGQQVTGPGSHLVTEKQGAIDGAHACAMMTQEGFAPGSCVFLDLENGPPFNGPQQGYVAAWVDAVAAGGYAAGVYCSFLFAPAVHALRPKARIWAFHVPTTAAHNVAGKTFPTPEPKLSGFPGAVIWQRDDEARLVDFGGLAVDLDVATMRDPSAPDAPAATAPPPPVIPPMPATGFWARTFWTIATILKIL